MFPSHTSASLTLTTAGGPALCSSATHPAARVFLHQSRRSPYDASDSQPGWMLSVDSFTGSHVCLNGAIVVQNNHLIDSSGLSMSEKRHQVCRRKEQLYWSMQMSEHASQPRKLWPSLNALLGKNSTRTSNSSSPSAQQLLDYFVDKVASVRRSAGGSEASSVLPPTTACLDQFVACHMCREHPESHHSCTS